MLQQGRFPWSSCIWSFLLGAIMHGCAAGSPLIAGDCRSHRHRPQPQSPIRPALGMMVSRAMLANVPRHRLCCRLLIGWWGGPSSLLILPRDQGAANCLPLGIMLRGVHARAGQSAVGMSRLDRLQGPSPHGRRGCGGGPLGWLQAWVRPPSYSCNGPLLLQHGGPLMGALPFRAGCARALEGAHRLLQLLISHERGSQGFQVRGCHGEQGSMGRGLWVDACGCCKRGWGRLRGQLVIHAKAACHGVAAIIVLPAQCLIVSRPATHMAS